MTTVSTDPTNSALAFTNLPVAGGPGPGSEVLRASLNVKTSAQLTVLTNEGDLVTISGKSSLKITSGAYNRFGHPVDGSDAGGVALRASFKQEFALSVNGDLSEDELADIQRLLGTIEEMFAGALSGGAGDPDAADPLPADVGALGSVAGLTASLTYSTTLKTVIRINPEAQAESPSGVPLTVADLPGTTATPAGDASSSAVPSVASDGDSVVMVKATYHMTQQIAAYQRVLDQAGAAPAPATAATTPSTAGSPSTADPLTATDPSATGSSTPVGGATIDPAQQAAQQIVDAIDRARAVTTNLIGMVTRFLDALVDRWSEHGLLNQATTRLAEQIKAQVVERLNSGEPPESEPPPMSGSPVEGTST